MTEIPATLLNTITTGDARELARVLPDGSVDLVFTDPVYERIEDYAWLAETAARVLKPGGSLLAYCAHINIDRVLPALTASLPFRWLFIQRKLGVSGAIFGRGIYGNYIPLIWCGQDKTKPIKWAQDFIDTPPQGKHNNHKWSKNPVGLRYWMAQFSRERDVIFEPFCGGGAIPTIAKEMNRQYVAFEIDPATAERARQRVDATQAMHPVFTAEQEVMALE